MPIDAILHGFVVALEPTNLFFLFLGTLLGTLIGVLPGIGPSTGIALLIPLGFGLSPTPALIMMAGVYYGAMYGGSTTSILLNAPGEAASVMTSIDGYQMARKGRPGAALAISAIGSFIAGTLGIVALTFVALPVAELALRFGPAEFCTLILFALVAVASLSGGHVVKGLIALVLGLALATVGIELQSGVSRFTFGVAELDDGIDFLVVVIGVFAVAESLVGLEELAAGTRENVRLAGPVWLTMDEWRRSYWPILRGAVIGFVTGVLPGAGATVASVVSYTTEKRLSKRKEEFGHGAIEGVAGPESANNAASMGSMVPLLSLGIPGSNATAIMLGALMMYGLQPGPLLFQKQPLLVWGLIASMYFGNLILLILNLPLVKLFVKIIDVPQRILLPLVIGLSFIGVYSINSSVVDLALMAVFGVVGYLMRKLEVPAAPLVMGLVLGKMLEESMRQALAISGGSYAIFVERPIAVALLVAAVLVVAAPPIVSRLRRLRAR
ncbi:MAG TPA: tripartite tricarboxylate transporter permease [Thermodesulfobacteriota bacterium]